MQRITTLSTNHEHTFTHRPEEGLGGLLLFVNVQILENPDMEDRIWVKFVCAQNEAPKKICFCYNIMPPQGSTITCNRASEWGSLECEILKFSWEGDIVLCADRNSRTGTKCDHIESDNDMLEYSPLTYSVDQDHPRVSQDQTVNMQGRCLLDLCIGSRLS